MQKIAQFKKVSKQQFQKDLEKYGWKEENDSYVEIQLPKRATAGSAGYDFFLPMDVSLAFNESIRIPSGIRCKMEEGWVLTLYPRSSLGTRYQLQLDNTVGVIDADYFYSDNEGHILIQITNRSLKQECVQLKKGTAFVQGIFLPFGITIDDDTVERRRGGFGSTG